MARKGVLAFVVLVVFFSLLRVTVLDGGRASPVAPTARELHGVEEVGFWEAMWDTNSTSASYDDFDPCYVPEDEEMAEDDSACPTAFDGYLGCLIYLTGILYCFVGLAIICEGGFKDSIIEMGAALRMSPDIAGATLMAGGTSSPELFTALVAIFGPVDDIGMGTIVGSAIFNLLIIIGGCVLFSSYTFHLDWKPVLRDAFVNYCSFLFLLVVFWDGRVSWYESILGVVFYVVYVATMAVNKYTMRSLDFVADKVLAVAPFLKILQVPAAPGSSTAGKDGADDGNDTGGQLLDDFEERVTSSETVEMDTFGLEASGEDQGAGTSSPAADQAVAEESGQTGLSSGSSSSLYDDEGFEHNEEVHDREHHRPSSYLGWLWHWLSWPYEVIFTLTVPPVHGRFKYQFLGSFVMSLFWLGALTTLMVKWTEKLGCILGISDAVMGVTFLAVGTSMPDALTSIFVAQTGRGNMAVCNALGSNIFDILFALCLPWVLSAVIHGGAVICVGSSTITEDVLILCGTLSLLLGSLVLTRWRLSKPLGAFLYVVYVIFITYTVMRELHLIERLIS